MMTLVEKGSGGASVTKGAGSPAAPLKVAGESGERGQAVVEIFEHQHHDTALLSLLLALGTFYLAITLQGIRRSRYLLPWMREFLADFGPAIALVAMTLVAFSLHEVYLDVLPAPDSFRTTSGRAWLVDPFKAASVRSSSSPSSALSAAPRSWRLVRKHLPETM